MFPFVVLIFTWLSVPRGSRTSVSGCTWTLPDTANTTWTGTFSASGWFVVTFTVATERPTGTVSFGVIVTT